MNEFDGTGRAKGGLAIAAHRLAGGHDQQWPQALAAVQHRIAHGQPQAGRRVLGKPLHQRLFNRLQVGRAPSLQIQRGAAHSCAHGLSTPLSSSLICSSTACRRSWQNFSSVAPRW